MAEIQKWTGVRRPKSEEWMRRFKISTRTDEMFKRLTELFRRFIYFEDSLFYTLSAIYVLLTYLYDIFDQIPYLQVYGLKGSGKTRLGDLFEGLCSNPFNSSEISDAALYREINSRHGETTMIIDEADDLSGPTRRGILHRVLRSGYRRNGNVSRYVGGRTLRLSTFCPKIIINEKGIQDSALESRTIPIYMTKFVTPLKRFRSSKMGKEFKEVKELVRSFLEDYRDLVSERYGSFESVEGIEGRDEEIWAPILIIAEILNKADSPLFKESELTLVKESMILLAKKTILKRKTMALAENKDAQILVATQAYIERAKPLIIDGLPLYIGEALCKSIKEQWSIFGLKLEAVSRILKRHGVLKGIKRPRLTEKIGGKSSIVQRVCYLLDKEKLSKLTKEYLDEAEKL